MLYLLLGVSGLGVLVGVMATAVAIAKLDYRILAATVAVLGFGSAAAVLVASLVFSVSRMWM